MVPLDVKGVVLDRHVLNPKLVVPCVEPGARGEIIRRRRGYVLDALRALWLRNGRCVARRRQHEVPARIRHESAPYGDREHVAKPDAVIHHAADETRWTGMR